MIKCSNKLMIICQCKIFQIYHIFTNEKEKITKSDVKKCFYWMMTNFNTKNECKLLIKTAATYKSNEINAWNQMQNQKNE